MAHEWHCRCFLETHYYLPETGLHHTYQSKEQFVEDNADVLAEMPSHKVEHVLQRLEEERERRKQVNNRAQKRKEYIAKHYQPMHRTVYQLKPEFLHPKLRRVCQELRNEKPEAEKELRAFVQEKGPSGIYRFPLFEESFCKLLHEEVEHFNQSTMPKARPNSMNHYGILLEELGFYPGLLDPLLKEYLLPMTRVLFPDAAGASLDHHRSFVVEYQMDKDRELAYHYDDAEVTLNVCIGGNFEGGELLFGKVKSSKGPDLERYPVAHQVGMGLLHRGIHRHQALPIESGERYNLIMWCRSTEFRYNECPHCGRRKEEQAL